MFTDLQHLTNIRFVMHGRHHPDTSKWVKPVEGEEAALLPQEAVGLVVIKDCPITVVPGFIACVSLDEVPVASRAKMFSVAQKYFSVE